MVIAQNIVHMMNGNITVESQVAKDSQFTVTIYPKLQDAQDIDTPELADLSVLLMDGDDCTFQFLCAMFDGMTNRIPAHSFRYLMEGLPPVE